MSLLDALIFGVRKLWINGTEQPLKTGLELRGSGLTVSQLADRNIVDISGSGGGGNLTAHYVLTEADSTLPNAHVFISSTSIDVGPSAGEIQPTCIMGTTAGTCCDGADARLSNARTPTAHASSHAPGSADAIATGSTSTTVCIGNDARLSDARTPTAHAASHLAGGSDPLTGLPPAPTELTTGQRLQVSGTSVIASGRKGDWWNCGVVPSPNPTSTSSVTVQYLSVKAGDPVRILRKTGLIYNASFPRIYSTTITAIKGSILDYRGRAHYRNVQVSGSTFRFDIYSDENCVNLIGATATFTSNTGVNTAPLAITAANGSGLAGSVIGETAAEASTAGLVHSVCHMSTGVCTSYDLSTGVLSFAGQTVGSTAGDILEVWLGSPTLVVNWPIDLGGAYASADAADAFITKRFKKEFWDLPNGVLCQVKASNYTNDTGGTQAKIAAVINAQQVVADGSALALSTARVSTAAEMTPTYQPIAYGNQLGLRVLKGTNGNSANLEGHFVVVLD